MFWKNEKLPSTPTSSLLPGRDGDTDRAVNSLPMAAAQDIAADAQHREVGLRRVHGLVVVAHDVERANRPLAGASGQSAAADDRHRPPALEADAPAVENRRRVARPAADAGARQRRAAAADGAEGEHFEEEVALSGKRRWNRARAHCTRRLLTRGRCCVKSAVRPW
jgi:hypothetical protein